MATYNFLLNDIQNSLGAIFVSINIDGKIHQFKTPLRIASNLWDPEKECPKNIYLKKSKQLNVSINKLRIAFSSYIKECRNANKKISTITLTRIIKKCTSSSNITYPANSLLFHINNYIESRKHIISHSTFRRYMVFIKFLERYEGYRGENLFIEDIKSSFVKDFLEFGRNELYNDSTLYRTVYFIRTILNYLEKRGVRTYVYEIELPREKRTQKLITLSEDELIKIKRMTVPQDLVEARDWLIISCYTGQRVSDFMTFNSDAIEITDNIKCLSFIQQKTNKTILLPIHPAVQTIMNKYDGAFPKKMSFSTYNYKIKEVAKLAGITNLVKVKKRKLFRVYESYLPKWETITSHIGRRSFASNFYGKIPTALLMETTGHSSEQMFHHYINQSDRDRTISLSSYFDEVYKKKFLSS